MRIGNFQVHVDVAQHRQGAEPVFQNRRFFVKCRDVAGLQRYPLLPVGHAADLQPGCRYDEVVRALGGAGEIVTAPGDIGPALRRAFDSGVPYLVNVVTDAEIAYPRSTTGV